MTKILIADDDEKIHLLIRNTLESAEQDFEIHEAKNGKRAIQIVQEIIPDIVILDVMMPVHTGYEVSEKIKASPETRGVKILFLTAFGSMNTRKLVKAHGGDGLLVKPFKPEELMKMIIKLLKKNDEKTLKNGA